MIIYYSLKNINEEGYNNEQGNRRRDLLLWK